MENPDFDVVCDNCGKLYGFHHWNHETGINPAWCFSIHELRTLADGTLGINSTLQRAKAILSHLKFKER